MRCRCRVNDQRFGITDICEVRRELDVFDEGLTGVPAALDAEA